jgi:alkylated DNA repair dioxygenase AlkB
MRQAGLFVTPDQPTVLVGERGDVTYVPEFIDAPTGLRLFGELRESTEWRADSRMMYGRRVLVPRETAARGERMPQPWTPVLLEVRARIEAHAGTAFDWVFINRYRDGRDSVAWHNDDDAEEDTRRVVASLSLGATRAFQLRPKRSSGMEMKKVSVDLAHGDLVLMRGDTQLNWEHAVPKDPRVAGERINLTFRQHRPREQRPV